MSNEAMRDLFKALVEVRRWIGDGELSDGLAREHWTAEYEQLVDMVDRVLHETWQNLAEDQAGERCDVVVTWDEQRTKIVAVTRQDDEGRILSVIAEAPAEHEREKAEAGYWLGHDMAVSGVSERWEQALTAPIPAPGVIGNPRLEDLYRRTEELREAAVSALNAMKKARIWSGGRWTYNLLYPIHYVKAMEELDAALRQQGENK